MTTSDLIAFRDAVSNEVARQYPTVDYVGTTVRRAIEDNVDLLDWEWFLDGPKQKAKPLK